MIRWKLIGCLTAMIVQTILAIPHAGADDLDQLSAFIEHGMELWHVPGLSVAVVSQDEVLYQEGFGYTAIDEGKPVDAHTLFAIASTTKAMVTAGLLMLVDEEKLSLDDPIIKHVPELHFHDPSLTPQLTVRDLLAHRTGLPSTDYFYLQQVPLDQQPDLPKHHVRDRRATYRAAERSAVGSFPDRPPVASHRYAGDFWHSRRDP
jgi:CubicO group peptidase (beta-lactamase class C family)